MLLNDSSGYPFIVLLKKDNNIVFRPILLIDFSVHTGTIIDLCDVWLVWLIHLKT